MSVSDEIRIRSARPEDVPSLVRFNHEMARETEGKELDREVLAAGVGAVFAEPARGFYLVAEISGEVIACLMITREWSDWRNGDFWWIQSVYVAPEFRRRGVFRSLYREVANRAGQSDGVCGFRLYVEQDNQEAQATYRHLGMTETAYRMFEGIQPGWRE